jgi:hypothetical protein
MNAQATIASMSTLTAVISIPRNVLMTAAYDPSGGSRLACASDAECPLRAARTTVQSRAWFREDSRR